VQGHKRPRRQADTVQSSGVVHDEAVARIRDRFLASLASNLPFLRDWGYGEPATEIVEGLLRTLEVRLRSVSRQLVFALVVDDSNLPGAPDRHVITVHLCRNDGNDDDDRLYVEWFAAVHRRDLTERLERAADQGGTLDRFVHTVLPIYRTLFLEDMTALLAGTAWEAGTGNPHIVRRYEFLERDFGFSPPKGRRCGHDVTHTYTRRHVFLSVTDDGGPHEVFSIAVGGLPIQFIWQTPPEQMIAILKAHPEIFDGDFAALAGIAVAG
jgi:hypothetical protein